MRFPIRLKLLAAFAVDLLLMIALGIVATQQMALMNERASQVATHTIPSLDAVAALKEQINAYRVNQLELMLYTSAADKGRSLQRMAEVEGQVGRTLDAYRPLINNTVEQERFAAVERSWERLIAANRQTFIPEASQDNTGTVRPFYSRLNPLYDDVEAAITGLGEESRRQAVESLAVVQGAYSAARGFILADTLLTLVISAAIGLVLSGRIARRLGRLTSAAGEVASGNLERTVSVETRDELGRLAAAFNQMVAGLRVQRVALEEQNAALQASLARQEQLAADLLRRREAEEEAYRAQAAAEAANKAKSMFLATMSHELRTPLNAILGYAQVMRLSAPPPSLEPGEVNPLDRILAAGRHLTALINNVLDFSKIEQGGIELSLADVPVQRLVNEAADVVAPLVQRNNNLLQVVCPPDLGTLHTDAGKVRQILINLLGNAAKFTEHGMVTIRAWRDESALRPAVVFAVSDTGIGIAPEHLERLFQPFSQVDPSVTRRYEGTGLGLALSQQLCLALGGEIGVTSRPGHGSTFTVRLPTQPVETIRAIAVPAAASAIPGGAL